MITILCLFTNPQVWQAGLSGVSGLCSAGLGLQQLPDGAEVLGSLAHSQGWQEMLAAG